MPGRRDDACRGTPSQPPMFHPVHPKWRRHAAFASVGCLCFVSTSWAQTEFARPDRLSAISPVAPVDEIGTADLDGDGLLDIFFIAHPLAPTEPVRVAFNEGGRTFTDPIAIEGPTNLGFLPLVFDFGNDGDLDLLTFAQTGIGPQAILYDSAPGRTFVVRPIGAVPEIPVDAALGDADGDGDDDVFSVGANGRVRIVPMGPNQLTGPVVTTGIDADFGVTTAEIDGDVRADLIVDGRFAYRSTAAFNYGSAVDLTPATVLPASPERKVTVQDFDGDGLRDILATNPIESRLLIQSSGFAFSPGQLISGTSATIGGSQLVHVDSDGLVDLFYQEIIGVFFESTGFVSVGTGQTPFDPGTEVTEFALGFPPDPRDVVVDLDGDGVDDLISGYEIRFGVDSPALEFEAPLEWIVDPGALTTADTGDVDGDGEPDVLLAGDEEPRIVVATSLPGLEFEQTTTFELEEERLLDFAAVDLGQDGQIEIVALEGDTATLSLSVYEIRPGGTGVDRIHSFPAPGVNAELFEIVDIDGDGLLDVTLKGGGETVLYRGDAATLLTPALSVGLNDDVLAFGDLDGDGDIDALSGNFLSLNVQRNLGGLLFTPTTLVAGGLPIDDILITDWTNDGITDIVVISPTLVALFEGRGGLLYEPRVTLEQLQSEPNERSIEAVDIDRDGDEDLVITPFRTQLSQGALALVNDGQGGVEAPLTIIDKALSIIDPLFADFDNDGDLDALVLLGPSDPAVAENFAYEATGRTFCQVTVPNAVGLFGELVAFKDPGSIEAPVHLIARNLPPNQFGMIVSSFNTSPPRPLANSAGSLCLFPNLGRYNRPDEIRSTGAGGMFVFDVARDNLRLATTTSTAFPGTTFSFQAWYRDPLPTTESHLTNAVEITYE